MDVSLAAAGGFELTDGLWVEYQFDAGAWIELIAFRPNGTNTPLAEDTDNDDLGDGTALTAALTNFNLPILDTVIVEVPSSGHPYGVRGVGEAPIVPPLATVANAMHDATGIRFDQLPMSPPRVLDAIEKHRS